MQCSACGGKLLHAYARLGDKQYCRRSCYEQGIKDKCQKDLKDKLADEHRHEEGARRIGVYDEGEDYGKP